MMEHDYTLYVILLTLVILWIQWRRKRIKLFQELRIPGPPPHFLFGNILELNKKGLIQSQEDWILKYGKVVGYYHGMRPILMIADTELLKKIFIKDFHLFSDRPEGVPLRVRSILDSVNPATKIMDTILINLKGEKWKEVRRVLTPTFSATKLKTMIPAVDRVTNVTLSILERKANSKEIFDIYDIFQRLTLDIICAEAFGMDTDVQNKDSDPLLKSARTIFDVSYASKLIFFGYCFPELGILAMTLNFLKMFYVNNFSIPPLQITKMVGKVINERRRNHEAQRCDLLQLLIDASSEDLEEIDGNTASTVNNGIGIPNAKLIKESSEKQKVREKRKLSDMEIQATSLVVFLAGFETTSSALAYAFFFLGKYPTFQRQIQEEIEQLMEREGELNYYSVNSLQQIERFFLETMRLYPPGLPFIVRESVQDVDYDGLHIPKGMQIIVPVNYLHQSSEYWSEPKTFDPDRFLPKNKIGDYAVTYWAFGAGQRSCIGTRLVHMTTKIVIAKILQRFSIHLANSQQKDVPSQVKFGTMTPCRVLVRLTARFTKETSTLEA